MKIKAKDNTYLLVLPNNFNGYNYFEVYIDKLNRSIHVFDSLENKKGELVLLLIVYIEY